MKKISTILFLGFFIFAVSVSNLKAASSDKEIVKALKGDITEQQRADYLSELANYNTNLSKNTLVKYLVEGASGKERVAAATSLGVLKSGRTDLEKAFPTEDKNVRPAIMEALAKIGNKKSLRTFENGFQDKKNKIVKYWALIGLSKVGNKNHLKLFKSALSQSWENPGAKEAALLGIGKNGSAKDWTTISNYADVETVSLVVAALKAGGSLKSDEALTVIQDKMAHANSEIAEAAIDALGNYKKDDVVRILIMFKYGNPTTQHIKVIHKLLKKNRAAKTYIITNTKMRLRSQDNNNPGSKTVTILNKNQVLELLNKSKRKFTITEKSTGKDIEDHWYQVKTFNGKRGYLFGAYITEVKSE